MFSYIYILQALSSGVIRHWRQGGALPRHQYDRCAVKGMASASQQSGGSSAGASSQPKPAQVLEFLKVCGKLKQTARTGWVRCGVKNYESVADHSWRMAMLPLLFAGAPDIDHVRCIKIGLVTRL